MKTKRIIIGVLCLILCGFPIALLSGCGLGVTPVAYVEYKAENEQVVYYTSYVSGALPHIFVFDDVSKVPDSSEYDQPLDYRMACENNCSMYISFKRNMGKDTVGGRDVLTCDIQTWYYIRVYIKKDSDVYAENKKLYLNGKELSKKGNADYISEDEYGITYYFEDFGLKRSNPNGRMNGVVNVIEYK